MKQMRKTEDLVFGIRTVIEAVKEGKTINKVLIQKRINRGFIKRINSTIKSASSSSTKVPAQKLNHMVKKKNHHHCNSL